ncbi:hypothetical protein NE237_019069 [Protea cynaroides]|uniref:NADH-quinone oxidoreductase subunit D domain-containing protein n=1 Tax=Protea cynaroides TaxID=273540 RepID=A0A9Q0KB65_9MAGN|nr:hypothetical protein NE237_019069 [Protea cynaroides]
MTVPATRKDLMIVNMGPHHPSMHGVLRLIVTLDGEDVINCEPVLGYLHRGMEKIAENRTIIQYLPYVTRWDYLATMITEAMTVNGQNTSYIREIMLELSRIASHLLWLGPFMADIDAQTPFFYIFRERERELIYDLFEAVIGMRMMHNYFRIGGVAADLPHGWIDKCLDFCNYFSFFFVLLKYKKSFFHFSSLFLGLGEWAFWGKKSNKFWFFRPIKQTFEIMSRSSKRRVGNFSDRRSEYFPWRWKIHPPGFINLQILPQLVKRMKLADIMTILSSIDIIMGEVDR